MAKASLLTLRLINFSNLTPGRRQIWDIKETHGWSQSGNGELRTELNLTPMIEMQTLHGCIRIRKRKWQFTQEMQWSAGPFGKQEHLCQSASEQLLVIIKNIDYKSSDYYLKTYRTAVECVVRLVNANRWNHHFASIENM